MSFIISRLTMILLLLLAFLLYPNAKAQQTFFPPAIPLAVRSPYLTCWDYLTNGSVFGQIWPTTFNGSMILGWSVLLRVDGLTYSFLGDASGDLGNLNGTVNLTNVAVTPTQTVVTARAGTMQVNLTFLNPIEPRDWVKQSIPFSYMAFTASSLDGAAHSVQVYSDVSGEWNSGDRHQVIQWSTTPNADVVFHSVTLQTSAVFTEIIDQAEWGTLYYAMLTGTNVTYKAALDQTSRGLFAQNGTLDNQYDSNFRSIGNNFEVFAISRDLGTIQATQAPVVWTVGYTTDPAVNYADLSGAAPTPRSLYYKSQYPNDEELIIGFLNDFSNASSRAAHLDNKILQDAASVSNTLGDLVSLAIAQVYGSTQLTIGTGADGAFNNSDVMMFMKNIGGIPANRVNPVEVLYAAFPAFMYIDPTLGAPLLEPLFRLQESPKYTIPFAAADLGSNYPNISGSNSNHNQGVEQSANMLIMTYAHARASGDGSLISRYYPLLASWANYLMEAVQNVNNQSSADGLTVNFQTNLIIKGIIAIEAMSKMSSVVKQADDADNYSSASAIAYGQWKNGGLNGDSDQHLLAVYEQTNSWTLGYNLFADVWLNTNVVESSVGVSESWFLAVPHRFQVYNGQSSFIDNLASNSTFSRYGMPVDNVLSDTGVAVSSWTLFAAAMTTNSDLRSQLIGKVHSRASLNTSAGVFPGVASPAQGAMFAPLALKAPVFNITASGVASKTRSSSHKKSNTPAIAGGIIGGAAAAICTVIGIVSFVRRRQRRGRSTLSNSVKDGSQVIVTPFNPISDAALDSGTRMEMEPLVSEDPEAEMVALHGQSSTPPTELPRPPPVALIPAGLSSKEIARIRTELRRDALISQQSHNSLASNSQSTSTPVVPTGETPSSYDPRRLHSEVESLRREMERLRTEGLVVEAPPSYTTGWDR
ncbi:hypothetical protein DFH94DRAFT_692413 [Russula ochroleuca]|uniref:DUF1793-domain-containing protein n=1 Tax=Russula ochroleuca TaxID=152965 RepID=A0A9P5MW05_9AGAM|nr:hypothetical protein DFH94DRAFT_692413 [Russula ochroleuca]